MSKHRKSEWEALQDKLAQAEYEREEARRMWAKYREENTALRAEIADATTRIRAVKEALAAL